MPSSESSVPSPESQPNTTPAPSPMVPAGYEAARHGVGLIDRRQHGRLVVSGADRRSYLHGLLTNDIAALGPGQGCYACYLTAQGRMISDLWVYELGDLVLLTLPLVTKDAVLAKLDQFVFSEDVQLGDVTQAFASLAVIGPGAGAVLTTILEGAAGVPSVPERGNLRAAFRGQPAIVLRPDDLGVRGYEVLVDAGQFDALHAALQAAGALDLSPEAADAIRIEGGIPRYPQDMDEETIPLEAGIESRAISLTKGCYVGQEVIIRVLHRGHGRVAKKLVGLAIAGGAAPASGSPVTTPDGRPIGHVTSAVVSPACGQPIALGYVHREFVAAATPVRIGDAEAVVSDLPFVAAAG